MGRKPSMGVSSKFFREPTLIAIRQLSNGVVGKGLSLLEVERHILKNLGIDVLWKGRQAGTNRPMVRVWIGAAQSKLRHDKLISGRGRQCALTQEGLHEADSIIGRIIQDPSTAAILPITPSPVPVTLPGTPSPVHTTTQGSAQSVPHAGVPDSELVKSQQEEKRTQEAADRRILREQAIAADHERKAKINQGAAVKIFGTTCEVNQNVNEADCLPLPAFYQEPESGPAAKQVREAAISLKNKRSIYVWGLPGSGKDAFVHAYSARTRTPAQIFTVSPNEDIQSWFFIRSFEKDGTSWEEGEFLKSARDGYLGTDGKRYPYMILVSDLDRATKNQAESLRLIMDSIQGRIMGPRGTKYPVFPGTQIVATANSSGAGDARGRCVSSNVLDASILDRFERKFKFSTLEWADEEQILKAKFPTFDKRIPEAWKPVGDCIRALRNVDDIFAEFGHRSVCSWVGHMQDILDSEYEFIYKFDTKLIGDILRRGARVILDAMPDEDTCLSVQRIMDPYIAGGVVNK